MTVRHLTRSNQLVNLLHRFGHAYSTSRIAEYETSIAETYLRQVENDMYLPSNICPTSPVVYCWDNNDLREETVSGAGTTHCTNVIIIQRRVDETYAAPQSIARHHSHHKRHQRSLLPPPLPAMDYVAGSRCRASSRVLQVRTSTACRFVDAVC